MDISIDGIHYDLYTSGEASVLYSENNSGAVVIPEFVTYNDENYLVTTIREYAFYNRKELTSVTIPKSINYMYDAAFMGCTNLASVHITDLAAWCAIDFRFILTSPLFYGARLYLNGEEITDLIIPEGVTEINWFVFQNNTSFTSVTIPESVTMVWGSAFMNCTGLTCITIGSGVKRIDGFGNFNNCSSLSDVYCLAEGVPQNDEYYDDDPEYELFYGSSIASATLHVPAGSIDLYKATSPWNKFGKIVPLTTPVNSILNDEPSISCQSYYDLNGRCISQPHNGIYINNGRKVLVK